MFQRILVPLDGSPRAESAIPVAARIARASDGSITFLRVATASIDFAWPVMESPTWMQAGLDADSSRAAKYLASITKSSELAGI